jgi:hypothetical protein
VGGKEKGTIYIFEGAPPLERDCIEHHTIINTKCTSQSFTSTKTITKSVFYNYEDHEITISRIFPGDKQHCAHKLTNSRTKKLRHYKVMGSTILPAKHNTKSIST